MPTTTKQRPSHVPHADAHGHSIRPIGERLGADERYAGRGVTIAFLDSGFYAHPDLTTPRSRILAYHDIIQNRSYRTLPEPDVSSWHGMMTSVVCAGNGALSDGRYRGLAHQADLVLLKVGSVSRIRHDDIRAGLDWVLAHQKKFNIRVVNVSAGGDYEASYLSDTLSRSAEDAVRAGIVVVAAVGNAGHDPRHHPVMPPASVPAVVTVGGLDDAGGGDPSRVGLYHSSYGPTLDGLQKPEVIAPAIWVAAPILPGTPTAAQAALLGELARAGSDDELKQILGQHGGVDRDLDAARTHDAYIIRNLVDIKRRDQKVISRHYKHVDGTSFAAPIVASVVAQMIEANPALTPGQVKRVLIETSRRLDGVSVDRQGWGVVQPAAAVQRALEKRV